MQKEKVNNLNFIAILLSIVMILSIVSRFSFSISVQTAIFIFISISTLVLLNNFKINRNSYIVPAMALVVVSIISYIGADFQTNVRDYIIILLSALLAGFNVTFLSIDTKKKMLIVPVFIALWLSMILFTRFIINPQGFFSGDNFYETIALNINIIAGFLVFIYPLLFLYIKEKSTSKIYIAIAVVILASIFLTKSRVAILSSFIITAIFLFDYRKNLYAKIGLILICLLVMAAIVYISVLKINFNSMSERLIWWKTAYLIFKENIFFGCGFGNYAVLFKAFRPELVLNTLYAHNIIMQLLSDVGIFGLLSFVYLMVTFYKKVIHEIKDGSDKYYYKVVAISITFFLLVNLVDYSFFVPANMVIFFIIFCSVFSVNAIKLKKERINTYLLTMIFIVVAFFVVKPVIANVYYKNGISFYVSKQYKLAAESFSKATKFDKKNPEYYYQLANTNFVMFDQDRTNGQQYINDAINFNKQAIELHKYGAQLLWSLSYLYWNNNDKKNAIKYMQEALKYDRFNPYLEEAYLQFKNS